MDSDDIVEPHSSVRSIPTKIPSEESSMSTEVGCLIDEMDLKPNRKIILISHQTFCRLFEFIS